MLNLEREEPEEQFHQTPLAPEAQNMIAQAPASGSQSAALMPVEEEEDD